MASSAAARSATIGDLHRVGSLVSKPTFRRQDKKVLLAAYFPEPRHLVRSISAPSQRRRTSRQNLAGSAPLARAPESSRMDYGSTALVVGPTARFQFQGSIHLAPLARPDRRR